MTAPNKAAYCHSNQCWISAPAELCSLLELDYFCPPYSISHNEQFRLHVPAFYVSLMRKGDWYDPLLLQVLPQGAESMAVTGFCNDAVGDHSAQRVPGLLKKYHGRALLLVSGICALNCRFCLRRNFLDEIPATFSDRADRWQAFCAADTTLHEVILSGGDPLMLDNKELFRVVMGLADLQHVRTIRIHTRIPIVLPQRIDADLVELMRQISAIKTVVFVVHVNHVRELSPQSGLALSQLRAAGVLLLHQMVLLKGVNDQPAVLSELMLALVGQGVMPYYLHQLDKVHGAAHFEVDEKDGIALMAELRKMLPGYAVPCYVREIAGVAHKVPLN